MKKLAASWQTLTKHQKEEYGSLSNAEGIASTSPGEADNTSQVASIISEGNNASIGRVQSKSLLLSHTRVERWLDDWQLDVSRLTLLQLYHNDSH